MTIKKIILSKSGVRSYISSLNLLILAIKCARLFTDVVPFERKRKLTVPNTNSCSLIKFQVSHWESSKHISEK